VPEEIISQQEGFNGTSGAKIPTLDELATQGIGHAGDTTDTTVEHSGGELEPRRSRRKRQEVIKDSVEKDKPSQSRRPVGDRWYYEPVPVLKVHPTDSQTIVIDQSEVIDCGLCDQAVVRPTHLGALSDLSDEQLKEVTDDELGACYLQGTLFFDDKLEWCLITGWGVECGSTIVFYVPLTESGPNMVEQHTSCPKLFP
jgi:hypothetical protein